MLKNKSSLSHVRGFTLIEVLVVIVIIAILGASSFGGYAHFMEKARQKNAMDVCEQIKTAWTSYHREIGFWPDKVSKNGVHQMDTKMCEIIGKANLLDVLYIDDSQQTTGLNRNKDKESELKYGLLDPIGLKRFKRGQTGKKVTDHLYQFVLDVNEDGIVNGDDGLPAKVSKGRTLRGDIVVWCWPEDDEAKADGETYAQSW
ncbi:MAG: prepilin-type N-terminal cleavage/methylation domain-containing protein [Kiritimatiellia bacterium]